MNLQYHPDTSSGKGDSIQFQNVLEAYRVLSRRHTRAEHDVHLARNKKNEDDSRMNQNYSRPFNYNRFYEHEKAEEEIKAKQNTYKK